MQKPKTIITPSSTSTFHFKEIWQYRELLYFFTWRDLKVRYKQTALGLLWALLQPLALMLLFTLVFSKTSLDTHQVQIPYALFVLSGLILWNLFYTAVSQASDSMVANANILKKIYFPRLLIPAATLFTALVDFCVAFLIFFIFCAIYHHPVHWGALFYFPAAILLCLLAAFGLGSLLGALNVKYRDFRYALPFLLQVLFFSTQIIYPATIIQNSWLKYLFALNPMNAALELFRTPIGQVPVATEIIGIGVVSGFVLAATGVLYFKKTEAYFADLV